MKTCIATGLKADGSHVCLYCGPDANKAFEACVNPKGEFVRTAAFIRPLPSKKRHFDAELVESEEGDGAGDSKGPKAPKAPKSPKAVK